jgi:hypothetical protein
VATYVPARTLSTVDGTHQRTFTAETNPNADHVTSLVDDACAWVLVATGPISASLETMAAATAAVYAAAGVERGFPDRDADVDTAQRLYEQALAMRSDLDVANRALSGEDTTDSAGAVQVLYGFPTPPTWGDDLL